MTLWNATSEASGEVPGYKINQQTVSASALVIAAYGSGRLPACSMSAYAYAYA